MATFGIMPVFFNGNNAIHQMIVGYIMKFLQFDTLGIAAEEVVTLKETYELLNYKYKTQFLEFKDNRNLNFKGIALQANLAGTLMIQKQIRKCFLIFTKSQSRASHMDWNNPGSNESSYKVRAFAILRKDHGKIFIRRKTLIDKVINAVTAISIDFKRDKTFSSKFYVSAEGGECADELLNQDFRDLLMGYSQEKFSININNRTLMVEYADGLDAQKTVKMTEFACAMSIL